MVWYSVANIRVHSFKLPFCSQHACLDARDACSYEAMWTRVEFLYVLIRTYSSERTKEATHVRKYDRADDRPKLAMLAINIGPMIDRGLDDNYGPILACYIGPRIAPNDRPRITARVKPTIFQIYKYINTDNKI